VRYRGSAQNPTKFLEMTQAVARASK
jgi:hypothetical protein